MLILSGDIGGTNTRLQLAEYEQDVCQTILHKTEYKCKEYPSLDEIIIDFFKAANCKTEDIESACFAVAGPIINDEVQFTNLHWFINAKKIVTTFRFKRFSLINDFEANGYAIEALDPKDIVTLQKATPIKYAPISIIGAGTGLGVALLHWAHDFYHVTATEGGHVDFAPTTGQQLELLEYLHKKYHRVSVERIVSGIGIHNIYKFVRDNPIFGEKENPELKFALASNKNSAAKIAEFANVHQDPMALRTMDIFIRAYASTAGNLALSTLPYGGLYLLGGIAPKMLPQLQDGRFIETFCDKGRMSHLLEKIPVHVVCDPDVGLKGAAQFAAHAVMLQH